MKNAKAFKVGMKKDVSKAEASVFKKGLLPDIAQKVDTEFSQEASGQGITAEEHLITNENSILRRLSKKIEN